MNFNTDVFLVVRRFSRSLVGTVLLFSSFGILAGPVTGQGTWETTLQARDVDAHGIAGAFYDTALNVTWLANWNAIWPVNWTTAVAWANNLYVDGVTGWRLPSLTVNDPTLAYSGSDRGYNVNTSDSELAHLFYVTLGNLAAFDASGNQRQQPDALTNTGPFTGMNSVTYWTGTADAQNSALAWYFYDSLGSQNNIDKSYLLEATAVHTGDVFGAPVPEPAALSLLGLGLAGLGFSRCRIQRGA